MKQSILIASVLIGTLISGCTTFSKRTPTPDAGKSDAAVTTHSVTVGGANMQRGEWGTAVGPNGELQKIEFRPGVSSVTVENLAKLEGCRGGLGAGLTTEKGPIEMYRMMCDNGRVFIAKCELRQCAPVR